MKLWTKAGAAAAVLTAIAAIAGTAAAFELDYKGSLAPGRFTRYVPPVTNPLFNETPYITTEIRPLYFYNKIPGDFLSGGGHIDVIAAEIRIALTERLGFIASKDGYADANFKRTLADENGFANISLGFKYALLNDPANETIVTVGVEYEPAIGDLETNNINMHGGGKGFVDLFASGATTRGLWGFQGNIGFNRAIDGGHDTSMLHYSGHVDYALTPAFFPLLEFNGFSTLKSGNRTAGVNFEGVDVLNFGSTRSGTVATAAAGARYRLLPNLILGAAYEHAVTDRDDLLDWWVYFDLVLHF